MLLHEQLQQLRLFYLCNHVDEFLSKAQKDALSHKQILERMSELELQERSHRSTENRLKTSKIGRVKPLGEFDWAWPKAIDRAVIEELMASDFIRHHQNCVIAGPQGVGKSMIAKNVALSAVTNGFHVLFTSASDLVLDLGAQESTPALRRRLRRYTSPDLLVIDELGYLSFDHRAADLLFEIISKRYECNSTIITTNLSFKDWGIPFQGAASVTPLIDRLTHNCEILKIDAESYRGKESVNRKQGRKNGKQAKH